MDLETIKAAQRIVYQSMAPTPQYRWPLLAQATGADVVVKHENHTPTGAFKLRGSLNFMAWLKSTEPACRGIVTATRGNHGQGQALAATRNGLIAKIFVSHGNSTEKNAAMASFGAQLSEFGADFDEAKLEAHRVAQAEGLFFVPPFHRALVAGVASYAVELFEAVKDIDTVYVPIGCGSGICAVIHVRDALGLSTEVVGVVAQGADYALRSFEAGRPVSSDRAETFADGVAVREPIPEAFAIYGKGAARIVAVSDDAIAQAMRLYFRTTHNVIEGAGAAPLAALMAEAERMKGKRCAVIACGANVDTDVFQEVLAGRTPSAKAALPSQKPAPQGTIAA
ncbi:MAG: threonine dehydratase [Pseudomonadota bacterium]